MLLKIESKLIAKRGFPESLNLKYSEFPAPCNKPW